MYIISIYTYAIYLTQIYLENGVMVKLSKIRIEVKVDIKMIIQTGR